jgi:hypothetical protein
MLTFVDEWRRYGNPNAVLLSEESVQTDLRSHIEEQGLTDWIQMGDAELLRR